MKIKEKEKKMKKRNTKTLVTVVLLVLALMLSGCGGGGADEPQGETDKTLTFALAWELDNLTPMLMSPQGEQCSLLVYETLVNYEDGKLLPSLAEKWEFNEDSTELTFTLKQGVTFHNGEAFNAAAVKTAFDHQRKNPNAGFTRGISTITEIEIVDDYTVKMHYDQPYFAAIYDFVYSDVSSIAAPSMYEEGNFQTLKGVVGTGPYTYAEFVKGSHTTFKKFENYVGDAPIYEEITAKYIPDSNARLMALETGEIDFMFGSALMTYDEYEQAISLPNIKSLVSEEYSNVKNLAVNASGNNISEVKAITDVNVRKAIAMAINKEIIAESLTYGMHKAATTLFPEGTVYTDVKMNNEWKYDTAAAAKLLDDAGWVMNDSTKVREKDGTALKLRLVYDSGVDLDEAYATAIDAQLAEIGIEVETEGLEQMQWWMESYSGNYDMSVWNLPGAPETPHSHFTSMLDSNAEYAALLKMKDVQNVYDHINGFLTTADKKEVGEHFDFLLNYINDNVIDIPVSYGKEMIVYNSEKISGYDFYGAAHFFNIFALQPAK